MEAIRKGVQIREMEHSCGLLMGWTIIGAAALFLTMGDCPQGINNV